MNINRWKTSIDAMSRTDRFTVEFFGARESNIRSRGLRCTAVSTPGKTMVTSKGKYGGATPENSFLDNIQYETEVTCSFMLDSTYEDKQIMELWQSSMYDEMYNLQYPETYKGSVKITQLGVDNYPIYEVELHDAFPTNVTGVSFTSESTGIQTFDVTFSFRTWSSSFENSPTGLLGGLFNKKMKKIRSKIDKKIEDKLWG
jgi:hypothetical protein|tara:strand:+ start:179 stop:781 length:603 start_codon:yes stop_codon:yes gene_type:complete